MVVKTEAVVINAIKYGESSLIVKCITKEDGIRSYMLKGVLSSRKGKVKPAYFQPLQILNIEANHNDKGRLNTIKDVSVAYNYSSLSFNIVKQSIGLFIADVLNGSIQEEGNNSELFEYVTSSLMVLDTHDSISNFHLVFLMNLTRFLGFYPKESEGEYFDLVEGGFTYGLPYKNYIKGQELELFKQVLKSSFDEMDSIALTNSKDRSSVLEILLLYFEIHLSSFRRPKSLEVLTSLFR